MSWKSIGTLVVGVAISLMLAPSIVPLNDPEADTPVILFALFEFVCYAVPPLFLIFSLWWPMCIVLAWFYWYMEKLQFLFVPMAGVIGVFDVTPITSIGLALIVDAVDQLWVYVLLFIFVFLSYFGVFHKVTFARDKIGHFTLIYNQHDGPYKNVSKTCYKVGKKLETTGLKALAPSLAGIYFDNPETTPAEKLRCYFGHVMHGELSEKDKQTILAADLQFRYIPPTACISTSFPYRNALSILVAVLKVYPTMKKHSIHTEACGIMELYHAQAPGDFSDIKFISPKENFEVFQP